MKKGWKYVKLVSVCDFQGGSQPPKSEWILTPQDGYIRMLQIRDFTQSRKAEIEYVLLTKRTKICSANDILIGRYGASLGKILTGLAGAYNVALMKTIPDENMLSKLYLKYFLSSSLFQNHLLHIGGRAAQAGFNKEDLVNVSIPLPPLPEQEEIVRYLDKAFMKIDAMKEKTEEALEEAKALFQSALTEMMKPKKGWEEKKLGEVAKYGIGLTYKPSDVCSDGTIVLRSSNIQDEKLDLQDIVRVNCKIKQDLFVTPGDILMCSRNGSARLVGKVAMIPEINETMTYGTFMMVISSRYNSYLYYFFRSDLFRKQIKHGEANMINQITRYMLDDVSVSLPPLSEQEAIVTRLDAISERVKALEENYSTIVEECNAMKQAMLREVFE